MLTQCSTCGQRVVTVPYACRVCGGRALSPVADVDEEGTVEAVTALHVPEQVVLAVVSLTDVAVLATADAAARIGDRVRVTGVPGGGFLAELVR